MMEIVWTETALETFLRVVDFLSDSWTMTEIESFDKNVDALIDRIATYNQICPESKLFGYRKCVIDEQNSMIYHIINNKLLIVTYIDNRSQHSY
jgi:plasmid stabilization system protein ParE